MESLKSILAKDPTLITKIQDFVLKQVVPRIFSGKSASETESQYQERRKVENYITEQMINKEALRIWLKVFIHSSIDLNFNYESLEAIGDKLLGFVVLEFIRLKFKKVFGRDINALEFTSAGRNLVSNEHFRGLSDAIGLPRLLITFETPTVKIRGDMFEALVGALKEVGDQIGEKMGITDLGYQLAHNFIITFYQDLDLKSRYSSIFESDEKSKVQQIFKQLKWTTTSSRGSNKPIHDIKHVERTLADGRKVIEIDFGVGLTPEASQFFAKMGHTLVPGTIIGRGVNQIKNIAQAEAYKQAYDWLDKSGIVKNVDIYKNKIREDELIDLVKNRRTGYSVDLINQFKQKIKPYTPYEFDFKQQKDIKYGFLIGTHPTTKEKVYLDKVKLPLNNESSDDRLMTLMMMDRYLKSG